MDISMIAATVTIGFVLLAALIFLLGKSYSSGTKTLLPPGSLGWPLFGETLQFVASQRAGNRHDFFEERKERYGSEIFKTHFLGSPIAVFFSAAGNRFLFSNENKLVQNSSPSSVATLFRNSLLNKVGEEAKDVRKMLHTFLRPEALQKFVGTVDSIVDEQLRCYWAGKQQIKALPLTKRCLFAVACHLFLSLQEGAEQAKLHAHFIDLVSGLVKIPMDLPGTLYRKARMAGNHISRMLQTMIDKRRKDLASGSASSEQDLLSFLLCNADEQGNTMTDDEIKDNIMLLLMAGHDTSVTTVTMLLRNLALNPHCYHEVLREQMEIGHRKEEKTLNWDDLQKMKYTWRAVQETLRLHPPVGTGWRKAIVDISYAGFIIPKGWTLLWTANATHKNPEYFKDPEKFDPSRFEGNGPTPYSFVPFAGGPRMCPGTEFARMTLLVFIHNIVNMFEWNLVDVNEKVISDPFPVPKNGLDIMIHSLANPSSSQVSI